MVDAVSSSFNPIAVIQGVVSNSAADAKGASAQPTSGTSGSGTSSSGTTSSSTSNAPVLSSAILSLLQENSSSSANGDSLSTLLGEGGNGISSTDPLAGVYDSLLANASSTAPLQTAIADAEQQQSETQATNNNSVENVLTAYNSASNAYNKVLIQNAQAAVTAVENGQTPLVA